MIVDSTENIHAKTCLVNTPTCTIQFEFYQVSEYETQNGEAGHSSDTVGNREVSFQ